MPTAEPPTCRLAAARRAAACGRRVLRRPNEGADELALDLPDQRIGVETLTGEKRPRIFDAVDPRRLDLDVLEPMLAPGLSHPEPGGLTVRELLDVLSAIRTPVIGADIVEYNPHNDVRDLTARVAAKFVKELVGTMRR